MRVLIGLNRGDIYEKEFSVKNTGNDKVSYSVYLEDILNNFNRVDDLKVTLDCVSSTGDLCEGISEEESILFPNANTLLVINSILKSETHNYTLKIEYLYYDNIDQSEDMESEIGGMVQIHDLADALNDTQSLSYQLVNNATDAIDGTDESATIFRAKALTSPSDQSSTLYTEVYSASNRGGMDAKQDLYFIYSSGYELDESNGYTLINPQIDKYSDIIADREKLAKFKYLYSLGGTEDAVMYDVSDLKKIIKVVSASTKIVTYQNMTLGTKAAAENTLAPTEDNYGISLYYRGDVQDNYVNFNNMCWRIVRIQGDGSIKLVLASSLGECNVANLTETSAFIGKGDFGFDYIESEDLYLANYLNPSYNAENSMKVILENWFNDKAFDQTMLKEEEWCLGNLTDAYGTVKPYSLLDESASDIMLGTDKRAFIYESYARLHRYDPAQPTLICGDDETKFLSYIGALTADEVVFAGLKNGYNSEKSYLVQNMSTSEWWYTLTLATYMANSSNTYKTPVTFFEVRYDYLTIQNSHGQNIRPSIVLNDSVYFASGDGTLVSPYVVKKVN